MAWYPTPNNTGGTLSAAHTIGGPLVLQTGEGAQFGTPAADDPLLVSLFRIDGTPVAIFLCTVRDGDSFPATGRTVVWGEDAESQVDSIVDIRWTDQHVQQFRDAIDANTASVASHGTTLTAHTSSLAALVSADNALDGRLDIVEGLTDTITGLTPGSVVFVGPDGTLVEDNAGLYFNVSNRRLGIGTVPAYGLHVVDPTTGTAGFRMVNPVAGVTAQVQITAENAFGDLCYVGITSRLFNQPGTDVLNGGGGFLLASGRSLAIGTQMGDNILFVTSLTNIVATMTPTGFLGPFKIDGGPTQDQLEIGHGASKYVAGRSTSDGYLHITGTQDDPYKGINLHFPLTVGGTISGNGSGLTSLPAGQLTGTVPTAVLPALAVTDTFVVTSQAAMLALTAQTGDMAVRTDLSRTFILAGTNPAVLADWSELLTPTDTILSVNGQTGVVVLTTANVAEGTNLYHTPSRVNALIAAATIAQSQVTGLTTDLAARAPLASPVFTGTVTVAAIVSGAGVAWSATATAPTAGASAQAGVNASLIASAATAGTTNAGAAAGGSALVTAGAASRLTSGNGIGGDVILTPGAGIGTGRNGQVLVGVNGTGLAPAYSFSGDNSTGLYLLVTGYLAATSLGATSWVASTSVLRLRSTVLVGWSSGDPASVTEDAGLTRAGAKVVGVSGSTASVGGTLRSIPLTPAQITADQNNYNPGVAWFYRLSTDASRNVTGLSIAQVDGQMIRIVNVGSFNIVLKHQDVGSTAANRFLCNGAADITLAADEEAAGWYDGTTARWRVRKG
jgi:hypothetical protein